MLSASAYSHLNLPGLTPPQLFGLRHSFCLSTSRFRHLLLIYLTQGLRHCWHEYPRYRVVSAHIFGTLVGATDAIRSFFFRAMPLPA